MLKREVRNLADGVWLISDYLLDNMYLVVGEEKAALIDAGAGLGNLPEVIASISDKPLVILLTHGHFDHIGGVGFFDVPAYIHEEDMPFTQYDSEISLSIYSEGFDPAKAREDYVFSRAPVRNPDATEEQLKALLVDLPYKPSFVGMKGGQKFDLGGRTIEVIHTPGHSRGSCCFLDDKSRLLFTGDTCNDSLLLNFPPSTTSVMTYHNGMKKLWSRKNEYDALCLGHDSLEIFDKTIINDYIEATKLIIEGKASQFISSTALHKGTGFRHKRALVWFDPEHIRD